MINRLSHTTVLVLDQDEALAFYRDRLGFEVRNDATLEGGFRWVTVVPKRQPDFELVLAALQPGPMFKDDAVATLRDLVAAGAFSIGIFETDDCQATYDDLTAQGVEFSQPPTARFYGIEALGKDNSGNTFSLVQRKN